MKKKLLGNSDLYLSPIGLGTWAIGGGGLASSWGPQDDNDSIAAIHRSIDLGMNWIDTAPVYGLGHAEQIVAKAVKTASVKPYIFSKCSRTWNEKRETGNSRREISREIEDSLRRLQIDTIDLYQMHWPKPEQDIEEGWSVMTSLQKEGKVRWIGVSNFEVAHMERVMKIAPITSNQPPYSMINRNVEREIVPFCQQHHIGIINYAPMHSGLLTGRMTKERVANFPEDDFRSAPGTIKNHCFHGTLHGPSSLRVWVHAMAYRLELLRSHGHCKIRVSLRRLSADAMRSRLMEWLQPWTFASPMPNIERSILISGHTHRSSGEVWRLR